LSIKVCLSEVTAPGESRATERCHYSSAEEGFAEIGARGMLRRTLA